jgi:hypothetical protein
MSELDHTKRNAVRTKSVIAIMFRLAGRFCPFYLHCRNYATVSRNLVLRYAKTKMNASRREKSRFLWPSVPCLSKKTANAAEFLCLREDAHTLSFNYGEFAPVKTKQLLSITQ